MDFLVTMLTDNEKVIMSTHNAASWGYYDPIKKSWNLSILQENGFPVDLLPEVVDAGTDAGLLVDKWFGVPKGTPVTASMGDLQVKGHSNNTWHSRERVNNDSQNFICILKHNFIQLL